MLGLRLRPIQAQAKTLLSNKTLLSSHLIECLWSPICCKLYVLRTQCCVHHMENSVHTKECAIFLQALACHSNLTCWKLCRLQQYVELLRSQHPQHVLQALNPLLLLSGNESHARVLAQYPPLFPALFTAIHSFHMAVDCRLLRCASRRTGTVAQAAPPTAAPTGSSDLLAGREGTDEADPGCTQEEGDAGALQNRADATPEEAWQGQLAVAAATVVHHLAMVRAPPLLFRRQ